MLFLLVYDKIVKENTTEKEEAKRMVSQLKRSIGCFTADFRCNKVAVGGKAFPIGFFFCNALNEYWREAPKGEHSKPDGGWLIANDPLKHSCQAVAAARGREAKESYADHPIKAVCESRLKVIRIQLKRGRIAPVSALYRFAACWRWLCRR